MRTVVFDLDGTLADTSGDLIAAANRAFSEAGHKAPLDAQRDARIAFAGGRAMLRAGFMRLNMGEPTDLIDQLYPRLLDIYEQHIDQYTRLYPGAMDCLEVLSARGWLMAVCTNKPVGLADILLQRLNISQYFAVVLGADSLAVRKPDPEHLIQTVKRAGGSLAHSILIGDTITDRETAQRSGIPCILVGFGPDGAGVEVLRPDAVLQKYGDLPDLLNRMVPPIKADILD